MQQQGNIVTVLLAGTGEKVEMAQRDFAEIYPGEFVGPCPVKYAPKVGYTHFMRVEGGLYQPVIHALPLLVGWSQWKPEIYGCVWKSAVKLALAGFVDYVRPVPGRICLSVDSYFEHLIAVRRDPHFWTTERRLRLAEAEEGLNRLQREAKSSGEEEENEEGQKQAELF